MLKNKTLLYYVPGLVLWAVLFLASHFLSLTGKQRFLLLGLSLLAGLLTFKARQTGLLKQLNKGSWIILIFITLYAGFSAVGDQAFLYSPRPGTVTYYVLFSAWLFPINIAFLYVCWTIRKKVLSLSLRRESPAQPLSPIPRFSGLKLWLSFFLFPFIVGCIYLYAFFPAVMTNDSISQWAQATGKWDMNDWHPVFHTLFNKFFITLYPSPATIALAQIVFLSAVIAGFLVFLYRQGIPKEWLLVFVALFSLSPVPGIYSITLWKDIPYTICLLWLTLVLARITAEPDFLRKPAGGLQLTLSLIGVALFRHNGLLVYILVAAGLGLYLYRKKNWAGWIYITLSVTLIAGYNLFIVDRPGVVPIPKAIKLEAPIHAVAAVMSNGASLPAGVDKKMEDILPAHTWVKLFSPYTAEDYQFNTDYAFINNLSKTSTSDVIGMYTSTFVKHPYLVTRDRLNGIDLIWDLTEPYNPFRLRYDTTIVANKFGLVQTGNKKLRGLLISYLEFSEDKDRIFIWRVAIYPILLMLGLLLVRIEKREMKQFLLIFGPLIACVLSLVPSMILQEYRYVCFIYFLFGFLFLLTISDFRPTTLRDR